MLNTTIATQKCLNEYGFPDGARPGESIAASNISKIADEDEEQVLQAAGFYDI